MPVLKFKFSDKNPTSVGPKRQPTSPPKAIRENIAGPPFTVFLSAKDKSPGHNIPVHRPHSARPNKESSLTQENFINKSPKTKPMQLTDINLERLIFSPLIP